MTAHRLIVAIALAALVAVSSTTIARAHDASTDRGLSPRQPAQDGDAPRPGDFFWQFAASGPLADQRIELAFAALVDAKAEAAIAEAGIDLSRRLLYGDGEVRSFVDQVGVVDAGPLLAAAGVVWPDRPIQLRESRRCRIWTPTGMDGDDERIAVATALGEALAAVLRDLGVEAQPCELATTSDGADLFVWDFGQNPPVTTASGGFDAPSFIEIIVDLPGRVPGGTGGGPTAPSSGNAGLATGSGIGTATGVVAVLLIAMALLVSGARGVTGRGGHRSGR